MKLEAGLVRQVGQSHIRQQLHDLFLSACFFSAAKHAADLLVPVGDLLRDIWVVPQSGQPELGDTIHICRVLLVLDLGDLGALLLLLVFVVRVGILASLDLRVGRLNTAGNNGRPALVQRLVPVEELPISLGQCER